MFLVKYMLKIRSLFWISVIIISGWNMGLIFYLMIKRLGTDSTSIGVTTSYIHWRNTFPSVSICLVKGKVTENFTNTIKERIASNSSAIQYIKYFHEQMFITSAGGASKPPACYPSTCKIDIIELKKEFLAQTCKVFVREIYYAGVKVDNCEEIFTFHELDMGYCFLSNNLMDYNTVDELPMKYSSSDKKRTLRVVMESSLLYKYNFYVHSPEDIPYFNTLDRAVPQRRNIYFYNVEEIYNNYDVIDENVNQRMCKYPSESNDGFYVYSFSSCMTRIKNQIEIKLCNCTMFKLSKDQTFCDDKGIKCLNDAKVNLEVKNYVRSNLVCYPSCIEQQINLVGSIEAVAPQSDFEFTVSIASIPSSKYLRVVTQTKLDLIVAVGGVIGLFTGASLLNILELISKLIHNIKEYFK